MKSAFVISSALILSLSAAQAVETGAPLASGKPAGVHQAQLKDGNGMFVVAGAALIGLHVAGALKHQFIDRTPELQRILPFLGRAGARP